MLDLSLGIRPSSLQPYATWFRRPVYAAAPDDSGDAEGAAFIADFRHRRFAVTSARPSAIQDATPAELAVQASSGFDRLFSFTRGSAATCVEPSGEIGLAPPDAPRFDCTGGARALLLERPATNMLLQSQTLAAAAWIKASATLPGPTISAGVLALDSVRRSGEAFGGLQQPVTLIDGTTYSISLFLKKQDGGLSWIGLHNVTDSAWQTTVQVNWPTGDGALTAANISIPTNGQRNAPVSIRVQPLRDGICRLSFSFTASSATGDAVTLHAQANRAADLSANYFGGFQLEVSPFATSYIPTTSSAITRAADRCRLSSVAEALLQRPALGLLVQATAIAGQSGRLLGTASGRILGLDGTGTGLVAGITNPLTIASGLSTPLAAFGCALTFDAVSKAGALNGATPAFATTGMDADRSATYLGRDGGGNFADGRYEALVVWPFKISRDALQGKAAPHAE